MAQKLPAQEEAMKPSRAGWGQVRLPPVPVKALPLWPYHLSIPVVPCSACTVQSRWLMR